MVIWNGLAKAPLHETIQFALCIVDWVARQRAFRPRQMQWVEPCEGNWQSGRAPKEWPLETKDIEFVSPVYRDGHIDPFEPRMLPKLRLGDQWSILTNVCVTLH